MFIPEDIKCFWCNGWAKRGTSSMGGRVETVTYFCKDCGAISHFARNEKQKIDSIEVEYKSKEPPHD